MYTLELLNMSLNRDNDLNFESFLQKRKDTLKLRWVTYWFRLQNTTLFFYTQKHGSALHLRGHYYIYTIQSVREVQNDDSKRFMFEIMMTSGKRKMLAADTAALRKEWVRYLWQAMHLSASGLGTTHAKREACEQQNTNINIYSDVECFVEPIHTSRGPPDTEPDFTCPSSEEPIYQNTDFYQSKGNNRVNEDTRLDGVYDVLPARNVCQRVDQSTYNDKGEYDCPLSYRKPADQESPYDVPSAFLRKSRDDCIDPEDGPYWKI
ncbi:uncharacterized protein LOC117375396 [Periophthalmus magnuspinnatus]|uniref:uncharacterized protein LOC117375396 n=1 Tax=Periophthalmus magnuspinnatus TaxID=409849 RepID=UPI0024370AFC|nr:uncharacterized protein LOC117375396 [Periophthalmus magnuspinnatus]